MPTTEVPARAVSPAGVPATVRSSARASARAAQDGVRVVVAPAEEVVLPRGVALGTVRGGLADLLRRPELRHAPLAADGVRLSDRDVVGERPLLPGATLAVAEDGTRRRAPGARTAGRGPRVEAAVLGAPWVVVRAHGPDAGWPVALAPGERVTLRPPGGRPVVVRVSRRRPDRVRVRSAGRRRGAATARLVREAASGGRGGGADRAVGAAGAAGAVGALPRRWRPEAGLVLPGARYTLHRSGGVDAWLVADPPPDHEQGRGPRVAAAAVVPIVGSLVLAAVVRQPLYALFSLVGVLALVPQLLAARRRRRAGREPAQTPAGPAAWAAGTAGPLPPGSAPGPLLAGTVAAHQASAGAWSRAVRAATPARAGEAPVAGTGTLLPDGALAVRGPRDEVRAVARAVVAELAVRGAAVRVVGDGHDAWSWCRWFPDDGPRAVVADLAAGEPVPADALRDGADPPAAVVLCLPEGADPPAWCRTLWQVDGRSVRRAGPDGSAVTGPLVGVSPAWAEHLARRVAALHGLRRSLGDLDGSRPASGRDGADVPDGADPADPGLPGRVPLLDVLGLAGDLPDAPALAAGWDAGGDWSVPLGRDAHGRDVAFDMVDDGPHLLVAGTTGSGKSELLQSLVLALAVRRSPRDLALALVDFKGGASFGGCARLPHVVGQVTDLDAGLAGRALDGLRAELHRRERLLAAAGAADLREIAGRDDAPPRLVVVIDEFRALADDLPEFLPGLLRVAAQGRSLGVHLVLATQRPSGAVSADVRANVSARVALRVVDAADSQDVVESPAAARIPPEHPGRAVLRVGAGAPVALQCAHAGTLPEAGPGVRRAPVWRRRGAPAARPGLPRGTAGGHPSADGGPGGPADGPSDGEPDAVGALVAALREAAARRGLEPGPAPWLPPLPEQVGPADLADLTDAASSADLADDAGSAGLVDGGGVTGPDRRALPLALGDDPARQRRSVVRWSPGAGHLAVVGAARSGRTTTLLTLARVALARGWHVHALVPPAVRGAVEELARHPGFGTLAGPDDPRRAVRLLRLLAADGPPAHPREAPVLVLVDGVEQLRSALAGPDPWDPLAGAMATGGAAFAVTADSATVGGLAARVGPRLVLLGRDAHADVVLGAPSGVAGTGGPPGRAAWLAGDPVVCQVVRPGREPVAGGAVPPSAPVVVRPLPRVVDAGDLPTPGGATTVVLGAGGDAAEPAGVDVAGGLLVTGPRGTGRTSVLRLVARRLAATGTLAGVVARDPALREEGAGAGVPAVAPTAAGVQGLLADAAPGVLVVDDLDALAQTCPVDAERLADLAAAPAGPRGRHALVAAATTTGALLAHRGPLVELRAARTGVVLHPAERGADEVLATPVGETAEPGPPRAGRGALVVAGDARPLQVARP
ncbi:FtsK/SpoIIIE domain-containing protein [Isoptericola sp. BMS4]|uniref:FtsK/SpoIIIE domain-containing protein n=1 Tax=Isoptericola sp. BMS4 TaxID=2527875 RepID=UPI001420ACEC|nr:FtsK/SpoIIIE domain-containing protein [Isoptericola sp. BMS4]